MRPVTSRYFWIDRIEEEWKRRTVVWVSGVRRSGKTVLCRTLADVEYFDCELPRVRRLMEDPEEFLRGFSGRRVVLDEIHRLGDPSQLLKIAADHYPDVSIVATGSSTRRSSSTFCARSAPIAPRRSFRLRTPEPGVPENSRRTSRGEPFSRGGMTMPIPVSGRGLTRRRESYSIRMTGGAR